MLLQLSAILGSLVAAGITYLLERLGLREPPRRETFEERVEAAANALRKASSTVDELEREINVRRSQVERLQNQQKLLELSKDEILAVSQELQADAHREGRRAILIGIATSTFFFLAGAALSLLVS
jgi:TolA-binding protein